MGGLTTEDIQQRITQFKANQEALKPMPEDPDDNAFPSILDTDPETQSNPAHLRSIGRSCKTVVSEGRSVAGRRRAADSETVASTSVNEEDSDLF